MVLSCSTLFVVAHQRWGFRQVEKTTPSMVFMHTHFVRGDKKRCLMMRSIVKKPSTRQQQQGMQASAMMQQYGMGMGGMNSMVMGGMGGMNGMGMGMNGMGMSMNGSSMGYMGMGMNGSNMGMGMFPPTIYHSQGRQVSYPSSQGSGGDPNQFSQGTMGGMPNSSDTFDSGRREMMEQQQRQMQMMENMYNGNGNDPQAPPPFEQDTSSPFNQGGMQQGNDGNMGSDDGNYGGGFDSGNSNGEGMSEVQIAAQFMKRDPSMEPWRALELAKRFKQQS